MSTSTIPPQIEDLILEFGHDLSTLKNVLNLLDSCLAGDIYLDISTELHSMITMLLYFVKKIERGYEAIQDELGIER